MEKIQKEVFKATEGSAVLKNRENNYIHEVFASLDPGEHCFAAL